MKIPKQEQVVLRWIIFLTLIYIFPIVSSPISYGDDLLRTLKDASWDFNARPLATWLYRLIFFHFFLVDASPLFQLIGIFFLIISSYLLIRVFLDSKNTMVSICMGLMFITSPFFAGSMVYKFDSITMLLAILLGIIPIFLTTRPLKYWVYLLLGTLSLVASFSLYQPAVPVYLIGAVMLFLKKLEDETMTPFFLSVLFLPFFLAFIIYYLGIYPFYPKYMGPTTQLISLHNFSLLFSNIQLSLYKILHFFPNSITITVLILCFCSTLYALLLSKIWFSKNKFFALMALLSPMMVILFSISQQVIFVSPFIKPRIIQSFSLVMVFFFYYAVKLARFIPLKKVYHGFILSISVFLIFQFYVFSYTFSNSNKYQRTFEEQVMGYIITDLQSTRTIMSVKDIVFINQIPYAKEVDKYSKKYPILQYLMIKPFGDYYYQNTFMAHYKILPQNLRWNTKESDAIRKEKLEKSKLMKPMVENLIYSIKMVGDTAVIEYKE